MTVRNATGDRSDVLTNHQEILDPTFDPAEWVPARPRRMALVAYVDFLILSIPAGLLLILIRSRLPDATAPLWLMLFAYALVELSLLRFAAWSPGCAVLGIRLVPVRGHGSAADRIWEGHVPYVSRVLKQRESWLTLVLGTWILNDAAKSFVRWAMWNPPLPVFGYQTDEITGAVVWMASGAIEALVAFALFRMDVRAVWMGVPYYAAHLASAAASWPLWAAWAGEMVVRRRAYQGLPVRAAEVEQAQAVAPFLVVGTAAAMIVLLLVALPRLRSRAA
jgi:hypothetical protein